MRVSGLKLRGRNTVWHSARERRVPSRRARNSPGAKAARPSSVRESMYDVGTRRTHALFQYATDDRKVRFRAQTNTNVREGRRIYDHGGMSL